MGGPSPLQARRLRHQCRRLLPGWTADAARLARLDALGGGAVNAVYSVKPAGTASPPVVLARLYGRDNGPWWQLRPDRLRRAHALLARDGIGPRVYGTFTGGHLEEWIPGHTLEDSWPEVLKFLPPVLARFHAVRCPPDRRWSSPPFELLRTLPKEIDQGLQRHGLNPRLEQDLRAILAHVPKLQEQVVAAAPFQGLMHGDLHGGNLLLTGEAGALTVRFIDLDFVGWGSCAYDIANLMEERCFQTETVLEAAFDETRRPSLAERRRFCEDYANASVVQSRVVCPEQLLSHVQLFAPLCHAAWICWALCDLKGSELWQPFLEARSKAFAAALSHTSDAVSDAADDLKIVNVAHLRPEAKSDGVSDAADDLNIVNVAHLRPEAKRRAAKFA